MALYSSFATFLLAIYLLLPYICSPFLRDVAQLVECTSGGREAAGSSPVIPT